MQRFNIKCKSEELRAERQAAVVQADRIQSRRGRLANNKDEHVL